MLCAAARRQARTGSCARPGRPGHRARGFVKIVLAAVLRVRQLNQHPLRQPAVQVEQQRLAPGSAQHDTTPPADRRLFGIAGVLLAIPVLALLWVGSYSRIEPRLWGFPFFLWYQMLWVFLSTGCTFAAYKLVQKARPHRPMQRHDQGALR